jgi:hypothetical protein
MSDIAQYRSCKPATLFTHQRSGLEVVQFELVLKGCGFTALRKKSVVLLLLAS